MTEPALTATALAALLVKVITGVECGTDEDRVGIIGSVHQLPIIDNVRSNWAVIPGGTRKEQNVIVKAAEIVGQAHPYVNGWGGCCQSSVNRSPYNAPAPLKVAA